MRLILKNIGKIKSANIKVDGITIIAGENNTGKSTIGKALYSIFNSFENIEKKFFLKYKEQQKEIFQIHLEIIFL